MRTKALATLIAASLFAIGCSPATNDAESTAPSYTQEAASNAASNGASTDVARADDWQDTAAAEAFRSISGAYGYYEDDGAGHIFIVIWQLDEDGAATRMGRMNKWDYTWRLTSEYDTLERPIILLEPTADNPAQEPYRFAYDEGLDALCDLDSFEARYTMLEGESA